MIADAKRYHILQTLKSPGGTMARWRGEQRGVLEQRKTGWFGRWREYVDRDGEIRWEQVTRKLCGAGRLLDIPVLDHLIVSMRGFRSLRASHAECFE